MKETEATGWIRVPGPLVVLAGTASGGARSRDGRAAAIRGEAGLAGGVLAGGAALALLDAGAAAGGGGRSGRRQLPSQLPHDVGGFTGREPELAGLASLAAGQEEAAWKPEPAA